MDTQLYDLAERVGLALNGAGLMLVTAESCTGGWVGQAVTMVPGSSAWFDRGFIVYSNHAKLEMLDVLPDTIERFGAVSEETARDMVLGALDHAPGAQVAVSVSGIAGPDGGTPEKPVGTVSFGWAHRDGRVGTETLHFAGDRDEVRRRAVIRSLEGILEILAPSAVA
jgi:nicotinamide-nucleotide amidase